MKIKIFILFMALLFIVSLLSQEYKYIPTVKENVQWSYYDISGAEVVPPIYGYFYQYFEGDTIINNIEYLKMYSYYCSSNNNNYANLYYVGALREEEKKVYVIHNEKEDELMIYDYNMEVGDCIYIDDNCHEVIKIEDIEIAGTLRKKFYFNYDDWIEGIGNLTTEVHMPFNPVLANFDLYLNYHKEDGIITYHTDEWFFSEEECPEKTSVKELHTNTDLLIENPVKEWLVFDSNKLTGTYEVEIRDIQGKMIKKQKSAPDNNSFYVGDLSDGIYLYLLKNKDKYFYSGKFIKSGR